MWFFNSCNNFIAPPSFAPFGFMPNSCCCNNNFPLKLMLANMLGNLFVNNNQNNNYQNNFQVPIQYQAYQPFTPVNTIFGQPSFQNPYDNLYSLYQPTQMTNGIFGFQPYLFNQQFTTPEIPSYEFNFNTGIDTFTPTIKTRTNTTTNTTTKEKTNNTTVTHKDVGKSFQEKYGVAEKTLPDGTKVMACRWSKFDKIQPEWLGKQKYFIQAANEMGLTLVYSDVTRTVAESNIGRAKKGNLVCKGGESPHNYGTAIDIVLLKDGKPIGVNSQTQTDFANRVKTLSNDTVTWGGDWTKTGERHHFELKGWQKYKSPQYLVG